MSKVLEITSLTPRMEYNMVSGTENIKQKILNYMLWYIFLIKKQLICFQFH